MLAMMMVAALSFTSCGDDDNGGSNSSIVGVWKVSEVTLSEGLRPILDKGETLYLYKDGTFKTPSQSGTWVLKGNKLLISAANSLAAEYTVTTLTATNLVLDFELDMSYHVFKATYKFVRVQ